MLRVDIVLVPGGDDERAEVIDSFCIANVTGLAEISDYAVWRPGDDQRRTVRTHRRADGWMPLVQRAIAVLRNQRKPLSRASRRSMSAADRRRRIEAMIRRDGLICWWCKRPLDRDEVTVDHVVPKSEGGSNALTNLRLACEPCNEARGGSHRPGGYFAAGTPSRPKKVADA